MWGFYCIPSPEAVPGLSAGEDVSNAILECEQELSTTDESVTSTLDRLAIYFVSSDAPVVEGMNTFLCSRFSSQNGN
jgi:hypothetical protein